METTNVLSSLLKDEQVPMDILHQRYGPLLQLVRILIGVVPNCDTYLEIWPPAFRTYNIMVPNLLNLPFGVFGIGGAPKDIVGLGLYVSSFSAECPYCTAHTCSYAMRRGADSEKVADAFKGGDKYTPGELATIAVAQSLSKVPCQITKDERQALKNSFKQTDEEWIVLGIVNMGFLNKFMDALSVELESSTVAEVRSTMGSSWRTGKSGRDLDPSNITTAPPKSDSLWKKLSVIKYAPKAMKMDKEWQKGVPNSWPAVGDFLGDLSGHTFPVLSQLKNKRAIKAIAAMWRENLNAETTVIGLKTKILTGVVFSHKIFNPDLVQVVKKIGYHFGLTDDDFQKVEQYIYDDKVDSLSQDPKVRAAMVLIKAAAPSPAEITTEVIETCKESELSAQQIVELITWISLLQMIHRLSSYYEVL